MSYYRIVVFLLPLAAANPICPMCSLGAQQNQQQQNYAQFSLDSVPSFASYPRSGGGGGSPLSMYQGDAAMFGTELGRAIAQRIQQLYGGSQGSVGSSTKVNTGSSSSSSYNSYPEAAPRSGGAYPPTTLDIQLAPPVTEARALEYPTPVSRGGCPYCFGGSSSSGYSGSNAGYGGSGGYAAAPARGRRVEFVKEQKSKKN